MAVTIVSSDKDVLQLIDDNTVVFSPYKDQGVLYDRQKVFQRFGVAPERITDIIALMGDDADNIPGVPGVGEKTAVALIKEFTSLRNLLAGIDKIDNEKLKKIIKENAEKIKLNKELAVLKDDVEMDFSLDKVKIGEADRQELARLFKYLEFKRFLKEFSGEEEAPAAAPHIAVQRYKDKDLRNIVKT